MKNKEHFQAFDKKWFEIHQSKLLWLLNAPLTKYLFRWVLRIHKDLEWDEKICEIQPNNYKVYLGMYLIKKRLVHKIRADFRIHSKFSKRVYFAFKPLWWTMHFMDWILFDRWNVGFNFGFATLTQYPGSIGTDNPVDGNINKGWDTLWATARNASVGDAVNYATTNYIFTAGSYEGAIPGYSIHKSIFCFDTSSIGGDSNTIISAIFSLCASGWGKLNTNSSSIYLVASTPASTTSLSTDDFDQLGATSFGSKTYADWIDTNGIYNDITVNASGLAAISKTGITKYGCRDGRDFNNSAPTGYNEIGGYYSNNTGTSQDPKLVITYTVIAYGEIPTSSNLKAYWRLNGNSVDSSANGNNGTDTAITYSLANGKFGQGAGFNGSTSKIVLPSSPIGNGAYTMSLWINFSDSTFRYAFNSPNTIIGDMFKFLIINASGAGTFDFGFGKHGSGATDCISDTVLSQNVWYNVIGTWDGTTGANSVKLYINGRLDKQVTNSLSGMANASLASVIGASDATPSNVWNGKIDEFIWEEGRAWSAQDVRRYYNQAKGRFAAKIN